jgi:hypothetical protein
VRAGARISAGRESSDRNDDCDAKSRHIEAVRGMGRVWSGPSAQSDFRVPVGGPSGSVYISGTSSEGSIENVSTTGALM